MSYTSQQLFDKVWDHFVVNRNPAGLNENGHCKYRGKNGARCAFGVFIPDADYLPVMEGYLADSMFDSNLLKPEFVEAMKPHIKLLRELQLAHDGAAGEARPIAEGEKVGDPATWFTWSIQERLIKVAHHLDWGLKVPKRIVSEPVPHKHD